MRASLEGRVAVITGGSTGIGYAVAQALVRHGARVVLAGRDRQRGEAARRTIAADGDRAVFEQVDVTRERDVERLFERADAEYGRIDLLFNNAGIEESGELMAIPDEAALDNLLGTNLKGVLLCLKYGLPRLALRGGGTVVNVSSFVGTTLQLPTAVSYGATKAAVLSITRATAEGMADHDVSVFAVCPWITDTPMVDRLTRHDADAKAQLARRNPSGRIVPPEDVAAVVVAMFAGASGLESGDAVLVDCDGIVQAITPMTPGAVLSIPVLAAEA